MIEHDFTVAHESMRFDRSNALLHKDVVTFARFAEVITLTEMSRDTKERREAVRLNGWSTFYSDKQKGADECVILWKNSAFTLDGTPTSVPITDKTWVRSKEYGGKRANPVHLISVPLAWAEEPKRRLVVMTCHMPLDNTPLRAAIWKDCAAGIRAEVRKRRRRDPGVKILITSDFNKNFREDAERRLIRKHLSKPLGLRQVWAGDVPRTGGTHGPRGLIDGMLTDLYHPRARLLRDTAASDHRPMACDLTWTP